MAGTPAGFITSEVIAGLHTAMEFGTYIDPAVAPVFYVPSAPDPTISDIHDESGIPYNPVTVATLPTLVPVSVPCAVEVRDQVPVAAGALEPLGLMERSGVIITLLEAEYRQIQGFAYVMIDGDQYNYQFSRPPLALGPIGVWQIICVVVDES